LPTLSTPRTINCVTPIAIESISFANFKALRRTTLPLGRFTLIVGPNGSGKSTALQGIECLKRNRANSSEIARLQSASLSHTPDALPEIKVQWAGRHPIHTSRLQWKRDGGSVIEHERATGGSITPELIPQFLAFLSSIRVYALDPSAIRSPSQLMPRAELSPDGTSYAVVIDRLRDEVPERFEALNDELGRWLPEFDRVLFETIKQGHRAIRLRTRVGGHSIPASDLSHGTLLALAMLTLAYLPNPPSLIGLEEPDRGIHPRLLRDVRDALYRLAYPENFGETRPPVQVIATTQSPYFLDLFRDHPEEIVIAEKEGLEARFVPLSKHPHIDEILADAPLGEVWYSGVLGGVPVQS
jgi:predicted ATPase